ncbi:hypothetical protein [Magnetospira thiophila]
MSTHHIAGGHHLGRLSGFEQGNGLLGSFSAGKDKDRTKEKAPFSWRALLKRFGRAFLIFIMPCGGEDVRELFSDDDRKSR